MDIFIYLCASAKSKSGEYGTPQFKRKSTNDELLRLNRRRVS